MALTPEQLPALKAAILAETDPAFVELRQANNEEGMAAWYNVAGTFVVWRTSVTKAEIQASPAFDWTRVDNLSVGKARIWDQMFYGGAINASQQNYRTGVEAVWVGTQADLNVRAAVFAVMKRAALRGERVFATGTGTDAVPGLLTFEGTITAQNTSDALRA
jgi:hypothetical protein